jgi:DNA-binding transcriptional ArsR family regulator
MLASELALEESAISEHLGVLFERGLVTFDCVGKRRFYRVTTEVVIELLDPLHISFKCTDRSTVSVRTDNDKAD